MSNYMAHGGIIEPPYIPRYHWEPSLILLNSSSDTLSHAALDLLPDDATS